MTPIRRAKEKSCITLPPKRKSTRRATNVVSDVIIVLESVSFILTLMIFPNPSFLKCLRFSLILSDITIVSLIEYPTIVRMAENRKNCWFGYRDRIPKGICYHTGCQHYNFHYCCHSIFLRNWTDKGICNNTWYRYTCQFLYCNCCNQNDFRLRYL